MQFTTDITWEKFPGKDRPTEMQRALTVQLTYEGDDAANQSIWQTACKRLEQIDSESWELHFGGSNRQIDELAPEQHNGPVSMNVQKVAFSFNTNQPDGTMQEIIKITAVTNSTYQHCIIKVLRIDGVYQVRCLPASRM